MATPSISGGSLQRVRSLVQQWEATHGRKVTPDVSRAFMEAELSAATKGAHEGARIEQRQSEINFNQEQALKKEQQQEKASQVQGGVQGALLAKELGAGKGISAGRTALFGADTAATTGTTIGGGASSVAPGAAAVPGTGAPALTGATGVGEGVGTASTAGGTSASTGGGISAGGAGLAAVIVAAVIADQQVGESKSEFAVDGRFQDNKARAQAVRKGIEFGGVSQGNAATLREFGLLSSEEFSDKYFKTNFAKNESDLTDQVMEAVGSDVNNFVEDIFTSFGF